MNPANSVALCDEEVLMRTLRIEINRGQGWQLRAEGKIPADVTAEQITHELQGYAIQFPRRGADRWCGRGAS
jgi:hypothetical protein